MAAAPNSTGSAMLLEVATMKDRSLQLTSAKAFMMTGKLHMNVHKQMALPNGTACHTDCKVHVHGSAEKLHSRLAASGVSTRGMPD